MFGKLLKYDFRSMLKQFGLIWPAALVLAVINRFTVSGIDSTSATGETVAGVSMLVFVAIMIAMFVITVIFVIQRFFRGLLGDEGYLMHTLPVKPWQLIASKLVCAVVVTVASILVAIVSILIICSPVIQLSQISDFFRWLWRSVDMDTLNRVLIILEFFLLILVGMAQGYLMLYLAMAVGHLFNKHRMAISVVAYIGIEAVMSTMFGFVGNVFGDVLETAVERFLWGPTGWGYTHQMFWIAIAGTGLVGALYFFLTEYILRNKLNLE